MRKNRICFAWFHEPDPPLRGNGKLPERAGATLAGPFPFPQNAARFSHDGREWKFHYEPPGSPIREQQQAAETRDLREFRTE